MSRRVEVDVEAKIPLGAWHRRPPRGFSGRTVLTISHHIMISDYVERGNSIYIQVEVVDGELQARFQEEVRFLDDLLYGELVHPDKSPLSESCRLAVIDYLRNRFNR